MNIPSIKKTYFTWLDDVDYSSPIMFEILSHVTTFENAENILTIRELLPNRINDYSCVTKFKVPNVHPLYARKVVWTTPDTYSTVAVRKYGNVRFSTNNLDFLRNLNFYMIEFIENGSEHVARVLATQERYPDLKRFDISVEKSGPIYLDQQTGQFVKYNLVKRRNWPQYEHCETEVMLEVQQNMNNLVSYVRCDHPRLVLKNGQAFGHIRAHKGATGELKYGLFRYRHRFNNSFFINPLDGHCQVAMTTIKNIELTSQWYPLQRNRSCHSNNVNELVRSLNFVHSFRNDKVIAEEDAGVIEDLHYIFTEAGEMPSAYIMLRKIVESIDEITGKFGANRAGLVQEVLELFIDHFKSHEAQTEVKRCICKFLEATYTLDINRALHGSQLPIAETLQTKLKI